MDVMWWIIWSTVIFSCVALSIAWFLNKIIFKHKVRVIDLGKQNLELDFKARDHNKDGISYWQLDKERNKELKNMPVPPANAINLAKRGKKSITCFRTPTGEYIFLDRLDANLSNAPDLNKGMPKEITELKDLEKKARLIKRYQEIQLKKWKLNNKGILLAGTFQPFTTKERMVIVNNFERIRRRRKVPLTERIIQIASMAIIAMVLIALMIFWGDIAQPAINSKALTKQIVDTQKESNEILRDIKLDVQTIKSEGKGG